MNGSKYGGGEGLPHALRAQVALGVRLQVRQQARAVAVQVWRPGLAVEAV